MKRVVRYEGVPLTEGHSGVSLVVEDGIVVEGFYYALIPVRSFEKLLVGQDAVVAPVLTSRICGLCQVTHAIASARAIESAAGIEVPPEAELLREVLGLAVRVYNNLLHQLMMAEDIFEDNKNDKFFFIKEVQKVRRFAGRILETIGGEIIHPPKVKVGGFSEPLEDFVREKLIKLLEEATVEALRLHSFFLDALEEFWKRKELPENLGEHSCGFFSTDRFYGKPFSVYRLSFKYPQEVFTDQLKREVSNRFILVDQVPVETGPRARKVIFEEYSPKGGVKELHLLRSAENVEAFERITEILSQNSFDKNLFNETYPSSDGETLGIGVHEAPRGTNVHMVKLDNYGKIVYYKIVVPTEINFLVISEALKGTKVEHVDYVIRAYDPCIVCSVH